MTKKSKSKRKAPPGLREHAAGRSKEIRRKVKLTFALLEKEIAAHDGVYPYNGGRLSEAEFCRRAGISQVTLLGPAHKETTKKEVEAWLERVRLKMKLGKKNVRKAVTERAEEWKANLDEIAQRYLEACLEMTELKSDSEDLKKENADLISENKKLQMQLSQGRVVRFPEKTSR